MAKEPRLKASVVNPGMSFIRTSVGEAGLKSILTSFDSKELTGKTLLPSDWVTEETYRDLLVATRRYLESTPAARGNPRSSSLRWGDLPATRGSTSTTNR